MGGEEQDSSAGAVWARNLESERLTAISVEEHTLDSKVPQNSFWMPLETPWNLDRHNPRERAKKTQTD